MPSRIRVIFSDGSVTEQECLYHPGHSFPDRGLDEAAVVSKFRTITSERMDDASVDALASAVLSLGAGQVGPVMDMLGDLGSAT
jgi:2-methylcitrate dehydratase